MDGLNRAAGGGTTIIFKGETLILGPLTLEDFATIENHLLAKRPNLLTLASKTAEELEVAARAGDKEDPKYRANLAAAIRRGEQIIDRAMARAERSAKVGPDEVGEWLDTRDGAAFTLWVMLGKTNPGRFKLDEIQEVLEHATPAEMEDVIRRRDQAANLPEPKRGENGVGGAGEENGAGGEGARGNAVGQAVA